jgi:dienelactone hydrolase
MKQRQSYSRRFPPAVALALCMLGPSAQGAGADATIQPAGVIGEPGGGGAWPAIAVADEGMRENTLYYPAEFPDEPLPLLLWGTGGCVDNGLGYSGFLREIASHGYFVISGGHPRYERTATDQGTGLSEAQIEALRALPDTSVEQLVRAIDWAEQQTRDPDSKYHGRIDTSKIAAMGHSCGGLQAIALAMDDRVATSIAFNSGVVGDPATIPGALKENANLYVEKKQLRGLNGPIAYINGGPDDMAYQNAQDDFSRLAHVPVFFGENGVGHGGTFWTDASGGEYADVAIKWLDWQLKGDADAAAWFEGSDCVLCKKAGWKVRKKGIDE